MFIECSISSQAEPYGTAQATELGGWLHGGLKGGLKRRASSGASRGRLEGVLQGWLQGGLKREGYFKRASKGTLSGA